MSTGTTASATETTDYAEPPGTFNPKETLVQAREAEGGFFVQTAGIHTADVVGALLEVASNQAEYVAIEYAVGDIDAQSEREADDLKDVVNEACRKARGVRSTARQRHS